MNFVETKESKAAMAETKERHAALEMVIQLPKNLGGDVSIDLQRIDVLTKKRLQELLDAQFAKGKPFVMARITTQRDASGAKDFSYYCAHAFNTIQFCAGGQPFYPVRGDFQSMGEIDEISRKLQLKGFHSARALYNFFASCTCVLACQCAFPEDPQTGRPLEAVHYFVIYPDVVEQGFVYLCSHHQLFSTDRVWLNIFYANQENMFEVAEQASPARSVLAAEAAAQELLIYAEQYAQDKKRQKQKVDVLRFIQTVLEPLKQGFSARTMLADAYLNGTGVPVNYQKARELLEGYKTVLEQRRKSPDKNKKLKKLRELLAEIGTKEAATHSLLASTAGAGASSAAGASSGVKRSEHPESAEEAGAPAAKKPRIGDCL